MGNLSDVSGYDQSEHTHHLSQSLINNLLEDLKSYQVENPITLDIGTGCGSIAQLVASKGRRYVIEKDSTLIHAMDTDSFLLGNDLHQTTLIDKPVDLVFSKPPVAESEAWVTKILKEAHASLIYLVLPSGFFDLNEPVQDAVTQRRARANVLSKHQLHDGSSVELIRVKLGVFRKNRSMTDSIQQTVQPFDLWFSENFQLDLNETETSDYYVRSACLERASEVAKNAISDKQDLIVALSNSYNNRMDTLFATYKSLSEIDAKILRELNVNTSAVKDRLKRQINNFKNAYWSALFAEFECITKRICSKQREIMLNKLTNNTCLEFSNGMAHETALWAIKLASENQSVQLVDVFENMIESVNVQAYKSNQNTFSTENWRYIKSDSNEMKLKLDYRIVLENFGGIYRSDSLSKSAINFLNDLLIVAHSLGFDTDKSQRAEEYEWASRKKNAFTFYNHDTKSEQVLFTVTGFTKGTLHFQLNQSFICKLNVEFGRLKGWIKNASHASEELDIPLDVAQQSFHSITKLSNNSFPALGYKL